MNKRSRLALTAGVLISVLLIMGAGYPSEKVSPSSWATGVCTSINDWVVSTQAGATAVKSSLTGTNPDLADVRTVLVGYLGDTADATTTAIDGLEAAGTPATPKGAKAEAVLIAGFKKIRTSLRKLQHQAEDMSIRRQAKALKQIKTLNRRVNIEFGSFSKALAKLKHLDPNHKLQRAFKVNQACQSL